MADKDYSYLKGKAGRKRIKFTEEDFQNIERWAGNGLSEKQIAQLLNTSTSTIDRSEIDLQKEELEQKEQLTEGEYEEEKPN